MTKAFSRPFTALVAAAILSTTPALAALQTPSTADTSPGEHRLRGKRGDMRARFAQDLGLSQDQMDRISAVRQAQRESMTTARKALVEKREALRNAMLADPSNQSAIDARSSELNAARSEMRRRTLGMRQQVLQVLTPEQREHMKSMIDQRRSARASRRLQKRL